MITTLTVYPKPPFHFDASAYSHGWVVLAPNRWEADRRAVGRVERLSAGQVVDLRITGSNSSTAPEIRIEVRHTGQLSPLDEEEIRHKVGHMFRLDEDFSEFYALCAERGGIWGNAGDGLGRLLRSPTLFEDVVKTIATTNTQWAGTKRMIRALVDILGDPFPGDSSRRAFPIPEVIAAASPETLASAGFGYRGPYITELAQRTVSGELALEELLNGELPTAELRRTLLKIKGVGPYAAATLLMLLGRYDEVGYDTVFRDFVSRRYFNGEVRPPREMLAAYDEWGRWRYLAYWLELWQEENNQTDL